MKKKQTQTERDNVKARELDRVKREIAMAKRTSKKRPLEWLDVVESEHRRCRGTAQCATRREVTAPAGCRQIRRTTMEFYIELLVTRQRTLRAQIAEVGRWDEGFDALQGELEAVETNWR